MLIASVLFSAVVLGTRILAAVAPRDGRQLLQQQQALKYEKYGQGEEGEKEGGYGLSGGDSGKPKPKPVDLIEELQKASIIPDVLAAFVPKVAVYIHWRTTNVTSSIGNFVKPGDVQHIPDVYVVEPDTPTSQSNPQTDEESRGKEEGVENTMVGKGVYLTLILTDPDAPCRAGPRWSQMCHWVVTSSGPSSPDHSSSAWTFSPDSESEEETTSKKHKPVQIIPYKPPGPPPETGPHRYVFVVLAPANMTSERLNLTTPGDRRHWGYGSSSLFDRDENWVEGGGEEEEMGEEEAALCKGGKKEFYGHGKRMPGVLEWAEENGLVVLGANFVYSENEKQ